MKYYDDISNCIIENGIAKKRVSEDVSSLPLFSTSPEFIANKIENDKRQTQARIEELEKKALRNLLALSKGEIKKERDYLNERIAEIELLRTKL
jgi:hypothetical protein